MLQTNSLAVADKICLVTHLLQPKLAWVDELEHGCQAGKASAFYPRRARQDNCPHSSEGVDGEHEEYA